MNRTSITLIAASGLVMLAGCGDSKLALVSAPTTSPSLTPSAAPGPLRSDPSPRKTTFAGPSNALSWNRPVISDEDLDQGVRAVWAAAHRVSSPWRAAYTDASLDGVNIVDRANSPADDSLQIMTGNGDPTVASTLVVRVSKVLCHGPSCG